MCHEVVERVSVVLHGTDAPSDDDWNAYLIEMENAQELNALFIFTLGGGPNAAQRKSVADMWQRRKSMPPTSLVTPSAVVRTIVTALNWVLPQKITPFA